MLRRDGRFTLHEEVNIQNCKLRETFHEYTQHIEFTKSDNLRGLSGLILFFIFLFMRCTAKSWKTQIERYSTLTRVFGTEL